MLGLISLILPFASTLFGIFFIKETVVGKLKSMGGGFYYKLALGDPVLSTLLTTTLALFIAVVFFDVFLRVFGVKILKPFVRLLALTLPLMLISSAVYFGYIQFKRNNNVVYQGFKNVKSKEDYAYQKGKHGIDLSYYKVRIKEDPEFLFRSIDDKYTFKQVYRDIFYSLSSHLNDCNSEGVPLIFYAINSGNMLALEALLEQKKVFLRTKIKIPKTMLRGFWQKSKATWSGDYEANPYQWAIRIGRNDIAYKILEYAQAQPGWTYRDEQAV